MVAGCRSITLSVLDSRLEQVGQRFEWHLVVEWRHGTMPLEETHSLSAVSFRQQPLSGRHPVNSAEQPMRGSGTERKPLAAVGELPFQCRHSGGGVAPIAPQGR